MFGYIRPMHTELKVREFEQFKALYCSLCRTLGREYGFAARFILNYDFVFLLMLLWDVDEKVCYETGSCPLKPIKGKCMCVKSSASAKCAGLSIILAYWKLKDSVADEGPIKSFSARACTLFLKRAYKKALGSFPEFDRTVREKLSELSRMEKENESSIDKMADRFAMLLSAAAGEDNGLAGRSRRQILYHIGRWIYIVDAVNDIKEDKKAGRYNPVAVRYKVIGEELDSASADEVKNTLFHSENMITSAYELLPENEWAEIIKNIIYLGLPMVSKSVFDGTFESLRASMPRR